MSVVEAITQKLQDEGVGTRGTNIFYSTKPDLSTLPNEVVIVYETGGPQPNIDIPTKSPTFQVYVRSTNYAAGRAKIEAVRTALHQILGETLSGTYFYYIRALSEPGHIGRDDRGRDEFTINFTGYTR